MAVPEQLVSAVKSELQITWQDAATDAKITGYIERGMMRLQKIAGAALDFTTEDTPRQLLFDYCRYANSQALEVFEANFKSSLVNLNFEQKLAEYTDNHTAGSHHAHDHGGHEHGN